PPSFSTLSPYTTLFRSVDFASPLQSWIIGLVSGAVSAFCFLYLDGWLMKKTGVRDTMGVHNLHGVPGIVGGLTPMVLGFTGGTQALAVVGTLVIALVLGAVTGLILRIMPKPTVMLDDAEAFPAEEMRATDPA